jgi:uncharacterized cupin superfamily protein
VLGGKLAIVVEEKETILSAGDAMYFDSGAAHTYCQRGKSASSAIVTFVLLAHLVSSRQFLT